MTKIEGKELEEEKLATPNDLSKISGVHRIWHSTPLYQRFEM
jgi:hypothetical protein